MSRKSSTFVGRMKPQHLLVIRFSALGDVAMLAAVVRQGAKQYPEVEITILSRTQMSPLFEGISSNVHFVGADLRGRHLGKDGLRVLMDDIHWQQFDAVADMHSVLRSRWISYFMFWRGKRVRTLRKGRIGKRLLVCDWFRHKHTLTPTTERYKNVFARLGMPISSSFAQTNDKEKERKNIGIAPFAAHKGKVYPLDKMEEVVDALSKEMGKRGEKVYLFGAGEKEQKQMEEWERKYENAVSLVGKHSMAEELKQMAQLRLMLTMDSGNMHMASLVGTRVVSIWGATHPWAGFLGYGQKEKDCLQRDLPCRPCSIYGNKLCKYGDWHCLDIDAKQVVEKVMKAIDEK